VIMTIRMSSQSPRVSVGMPVYNAEPYLEEALESLLGQSFDDFELVISDNASSDKTGDICRAYALKDERIKYFCMRQNYGMIDNFNTVFRLSTGEYFKWAASDDVCGRDYLLRAVEVLEQDPSTVLVWGKTVGIDERGQRVPVASEVTDMNLAGSVYSQDPTIRFLRLMRNIWWVDGPFYGLIRAKALEAARWLLPRHIGGDQILLTELSLTGRFFELPEEMLFLRVHAGSTSRQKRTLRDRSRLVFQRDPGWGPIGWWRLFRGYPERLLMYTIIIRNAPISARQKWICQQEVARAAVSWASLRVGQVTPGASLWPKVRC
jgi:glycosyltransferase involved in cell wall biosynthesis